MHIKKPHSILRNHVNSWINFKFNCPFLFINYEELVYDKTNTILKLIEFFKEIII